PPADGQMHREGCLDEFGIHVSLGAPHPAGFVAVPADNIRNSSIKLGAFCVSQKLPVAVLGGPLQGYVDISGPNALQIRLAPRRLQRWRRFAGDRWRLLRCGSLGAFASAYGDPDEASKRSRAGDDAEGNREGCTRQQRSSPLL